jgi:subtilisin family serine protease
MLRKNKCSLLPFIRQNIYGLDYNNQQIIPWSISYFKLEKEWAKAQGEGVTVAVIDTGCDLDHPDLKDSLVDGYNFIGRNRTPVDDNGHGSHVAGTIAAQNNKKGIVGVAPKSKIMPIKSLDANGTGDLKHVCEGILFAADNGADIITMSLGTPTGSMQMRQAINYAVNKGCVFFCAAGNSGQRSELMYPAKYTDTISVGSISNSLKISRFSCSSGSELDFLAPGENVISCVPDDSYATMSGTSMANPFAAGCAALLMSYKKKRLSKFDHIEHFSKFSLKPEYLFEKYKSRGIITPVLV